jgi:hypothetical protein
VTRRIQFYRQERDSRLFEIIINLTFMALTSSNPHSSLAVPFAETKNFDLITAFWLLCGLLSVFCILNFNARKPA